MLTLAMGLVLSGSDCSGVDPVDDPNGVLINGIVWAKYNVNTPGNFTTAPEAAGMFYQWNRRVGWSSTNPRTSSPSGNTWNNTAAVGTTWEEANNPCPAGWQVPTYAQLGALIAGSTWTTVGGVNGRRCGSGADNIFLPAAGVRSEDGSLLSVGEVGSYWASDQGSNEIGRCIVFVTSDADSSPAITLKVLGYSVRCIKK